MLGDEASHTRNTSTATTAHPTQVPTPSPLSQLTQTFPLLPTSHIHIIHSSHRLHTHKQTPITNQNTPTLTLTRPQPLAHRQQPYPVPRSKPLIHHLKHSAPKSTCPTTSSLCASTAAGAVSSPPSLTTCTALTLLLQQHRRQRHDGHHPTSVRICAHRQIHAQFDQVSHARARFPRFHRTGAALSGALQARLSVDLGTHRGEDSRGLARIVKSLMPKRTKYDGCCLLGGAHARESRSTSSCSSRMRPSAASGSLTTASSHTGSIRASAPAVARVQPSARAHT